METQEFTLQMPALTEDAALKKQEGLLKVTYALYALSIILPITSIVGVVIAYIKRGEIEGSYLDTHYRWLIRTFWWSALLGIVGLVTFFFGIGIVVFVATGVWFIYRVIKGFLKLNDGLAVQ
jgi:uncharacterized membrane protein